VTIFTGNGGGGISTASDFAGVVLLALVVELGVEAGIGVVLMMPVFDIGFEAAVVLWSEALVDDFTVSFTAG
jgi:hypothetical protein